MAPKNFLRNMTIAVGLSPLDENSSTLSLGPRAPSPRSAAQAQFLRIMRSSEQVCFRLPQVAGEGARGPGESVESTISN
jgi:hypothetical protein